MKFDAREYAEARARIRMQRRVQRRGQLYHLDGHIVPINSSMTLFDSYIDENIDIDVETKIMALKVSGSIVSVVSKIDGKAFFMGSGTIIDCKEINGTYSSTILTSASLLCNGLGTVPDDIKIDVMIRDGTLLDGQIFTYDVHYNIAAIKIQSNVALSNARVRLLDDSISLDPGSLEFQIHPHSKFKLCPGEKVVALGRYFIEPSLMAAPGIFSLDRENFDFDCKELMRANCRISKSGIGGPIMNRHGEVIGVAFYSEQFTPFLPINIALRCFEHLKIYGKFCPLWVGLEMANLHVANLSLLDRIRKKFPNIFEGVIVEKVLPGSPADIAGVLPFDVIVKCHGKIIRSSLEFIETIWHRPWESLEVVVIRLSSGASVDLNLIVIEISAGKINRWPLPEERFLTCRRVRIRS